MKRLPVRRALAAAGVAFTTWSRALATAELQLIRLASAFALWPLLGCSTDTAGLERRDPPAVDPMAAAGSANAPDPAEGMTGGAGGGGEPSPSGKAGSFVVLDGLVDGGRLFVCLRDGATGALLQGGSGMMPADSPMPTEGLEFGHFQRFPFDWDVDAVDVEVQLFRAQLGAPETESCEALRQAAAISPPEVTDAGALEAATPPGVRSAGSLTLARGSLFEGRHYVLVVTGCAAPDAVAVPQLCGEPDPLFGGRSELILVEFGLELPEDAGSFGLQFLNASRSLGPADLSLQVGLPEVSVPFVSDVGFGVLRPRSVAGVEQPFALELRGRGTNVAPYSQSWTETLRAGSLELEPGRNYLLASIGPLPRADGSGAAAPLLVLIPAE